MTVGDPMLDEAVEAARLDEGLAPSDVAATRSRVLESLAQRRTQRRGLLTFALVAGLCMIGTTSWAWVSGWLPARLGGAAEPRAPKHGASPATPGRASASRVAAAPVESAPMVPAPESSAPPIAPAPTASVSEERGAPPRAVAPARPRAVAPARPRAPAVAPTEASEGRTPVPTASPAAPASAEARDAELVAFRHAHDAHFRGEPQRAVLARWDAYLATFPSGRLAPEARWNRAVLLVQLGDRVAARAALAPFAEGVDGGYRQREATRLLESLGEVVAPR